MNRSALILISALLAGCNVHSKGGADGDENVSINADAAGNIAFDVPFMKGQVKVPAGMMHNGDLDIDGVKLMPGSEVTGFNVDAREKNSKVDIGFSAPASPDQVRAYFLDQFKQKGVKAALSGDAVAGRSKDGDQFVIHVSPAQKGSAGKIEIHSNDSLSPGHGQFEDIGNAAGNDVHLKRGQQHRRG